jgi:ADP-ribosylglycohydrolase
MLEHRRYMHMLNKKKILSGVYGLAIGDALGVPVEFNSREDLQRNPVTGMRAGGTHNQPKGVWSDDTSMVLATMEAMSRNNWGADTIMYNFSRWLYNAEFTATGNVFDVGNTTAKAIQRYRLGELPENWGGTDIRDNGNGSLMRMLPLIYYVYDKGRGIHPGDTNFIEAVSSLTHAHYISKQSCVTYVYTGVYIMRYGSSMGLRTAIKYALKDLWAYYKEGYSYLDRLKCSEKYIKSSGYVVDSLEASLWCLYNTISYREAVLKAVNLGGDTDTIGAITGSLAGLYYGFDNIPKEWVHDLQNKTLINSICGKFYDNYK